MDIAKNSKPAAKRWLIDASIYIFRAYFSLPPNWQSKEGYDTEAVYGFSNFLLDVHLHKPTHVGVCFDESLETGFRHQIYSGYKASRALPDEALAYQLIMCQEVCRALGFASFASEEFEADDLLGSLLTALHENPESVAILSRDKDLGQLLSRDQDYLWDYAADTRSYRAQIFDKFGVWPEQLIDYLALVGDTSDDIPGVAGVGKKTAAAILANDRSLTYWLSNLEKLKDLNIRGAKQLPAKFSEHIEQINMAKRLTRIVCDIPLVKSECALVPSLIDAELTRALFEQLGISGLNKKLQRAIASQT